MRNRGGEFRMKILFTWSGGKDSALALFEILNRGGVEVCALLTTVTEDYGRVSMHGVRETLLEQQSKALGIPLHTVRIGKDATNERYENGMREVLEEYKESGVKSVAYGDLFLEEIRSYREKNLEAVGMKALFPLWGRDTNTLGRRFLDLGSVTGLMLRVAALCSRDTQIRGPIELSNRAEAALSARRSTRTPIPGRAVVHHRRRDPCVSYAAR
jgi:uncharacterized protein (TIGR00290 family)